MRRQSDTAIECRHQPRKQVFDAPSFRGVSVAQLSPMPRAVSSTRDQSADSEDTAQHDGRLRGVLLGQPS
jgi:hypothetical protein